MGWMDHDAFAVFRGELQELGGSLSENLIVLRSAASTSGVARDVIEGLPPDAYPATPTYVVAYEQVAGRGRLGRSWRSPAGAGLYGSLLLPLAGRIAPPELPLVVAVALCRGVRDAGATACELKWPNDLVVGSGKLGGILIEVLAPHPQEGATAIIGFGINLLDGESQVESVGGTSMERQVGRPMGAAELLGRLAVALRRVPEDLRSPRQTVSVYRDMVRHRSGDKIGWRQGDTAVEGRFVCIDDAGRMVLDTHQGRRVLAVGDIIEP